jgi:hypothetical protein
MLLLHSDQNWTLHPVVYCCDRRTICRFRLVCFILLWDHNWSCSACVYRATSISCFQKLIVVQNWFTDHQEGPCISSLVLLLILPSFIHNRRMLGHGDGLLWNRQVVTRFLDRDNLLECERPIICDICYFYLLIHELVHRFILCSVTWRRQWLSQ